MPKPDTQTALDRYVAAPDGAYRYELANTIDGEGYTAYVIRMTSQRWLTTQQVDDPVWWHWLTIVVPDEPMGNTGMLLISGGSRSTDLPESADQMLVKFSKATHTVTAKLHNVPNQPVRFAGDDFGPRVEDELITYGWRNYLESGAREQDAIWLARLPMTKAAVRAMDTITDFCAAHTGSNVDRFVVAGASKRGWTTWTTGIVDDRVVAIAPIVIDMLNVVPSFDHHWRAYGFWAPAVDDYVREGIFDWKRSAEYRRLIQIVEPYSYLDRLTMPKFLLNATGDQFFLPDSWKFYWEDLKAEKHIRYVPNTDHSLDDSDAVDSFLAFYHAVVTDTPRPRFDWRVEDSVLHISTDKASPPDRITLWQATNPKARDFRLDTIGKAWKGRPVDLSPDGKYRLTLQPPDTGYTAFLAELSFPGPGEEPLVFSTGVVVVPDTYPFAPYTSDQPRGTQLPATD